MHGRVRAARLIILVAILLILGSVKFFFHLGSGPFGLDAANYLQIARNVEEGRGLLTSISLYYLGLKHLPGPMANIYPVWPLLMGYAGRVLGLFRAADWLSKLFYFLDLITIYILANRMMVRIAGRAEVWPSQPFFTVGHLFAIFLGANMQFFVSTTFPYTEGLAFFLAFVALICVDRMEVGTSFAWPIVAGLAAGLALLTRTQMVIVCISLPLVAVWRLCSERRLLTRVCAMLITIGAIGVYWYFGVFHAPQDRVDIGGFVMWVPQPATGTWLLERVDGLITSLNPLSVYSYFHLLGLTAAIPLIALPVFIWRQRKNWRAVVCPPSSFAVVTTTIVTGLGFFASLNLYHGAYFMPWLFGYRHGLPYLFLILPAALYLLALDSRALRVTVLVFIAIEVLRGGIGILGFVTEPHPPALTPAEQQLVSWLDSQRPVPTIMSTHAQDLGIQTRAPIHWAYCQETPEKTVDMLRKLPIKYVIVYEYERPCPHLKGLGHQLRVERAFGEEPNRIFVLGRQPGFK